MSPWSEYTRPFAAVTPTCVHGPLLPSARSTLKPLSFEELSVQSRSIRDDEIDVAFRLLGASGGPDPGVCVASGVLAEVGVRVGVAVTASPVGVRVRVAVGAAVVAEAALELADSPAVLNARTR